MSLLFIYILFLLFSLPLFQFRLLKGESNFTNALLFSLILVGGIALFLTNLKSVYSYPVSAIILFLRFSGRLQLRFVKTGLFQNILVSTFIFFIFLLLFWRNGNIFFLHSDYLFWIRLIDTNLQYGVENAGTFYNVVSDTYPSNEIYHYFEFWLTSLGNLIDAQPTAMNLFLFAYPVGSVLLIIGLKELLQTFFVFRNAFAAIVATLFVFMALLFFSHPWELITEISFLKKMPISSMHPWWQGFKTCFVTLAGLPLFLYWSTKKAEWIYVLSVSVFLYPPVLPILIFTACLSWTIERVRMNNPPIWSLISLIASGICFALFYTITGKGGSTVSGFAPMEWLSLSNWFRFIPAIIMKSLLIPFVALVPLLVYLCFHWRKNELQKNFLINILFLYIVCLGVWMAFIKNIDANQSFLLLFTPVVCISVVVLLLQLWFRRQFVVAIILTSIYLGPELARAFTHQSPLPQTNITTTAFLKRAGTSSIVYVPTNNEKKNVYQFNDRVYTGIDHFLIVNPELKLYSMASAGITDTTSFNPITLSVYQSLRNMSPFYKSCGFVQPASECLRSWIHKNKIQYVCVRAGTSMPVSFKQVSVDSDFVFYELK